MVHPEDITEMKKLQQKYQILSAVPGANPNIVIIMECINTIVYVNPAGMAWINEKGSTDREMIKKILPDNPEEALCNRCDRKRKKSWTQVADGSKYDIKLSPLPDHKRCMITATDVTEFERLSEEHKVFFQAFNEVKSAILVTDPQGKTTFVNSYFEDLYNLPKDEVLGKNPRILNPGREAYRELGFGQDEYDRFFDDMWSQITNPLRGY